MSKNMLFFMSWKWIIDYILCIGYAYYIQVCLINVLSYKTIVYGEIFRPNVIGANPTYTL